VREVLYIDTIACFGHVNLNKNYLQQFRNCGFKISVISQLSYLKSLELLEGEKLLALPDSYFTYTGAIINRILEIKKLRFIKKNVVFDKYDVVFFSYFDEIALYFVQMQGNLIFMCHNNVSGLKNMFKLFFLKNISKRGDILVFNELIKNQFIKYGISNIIVEPLGLSPPYKTSQSNRILLENLDFRLVDEYFSLGIFIPEFSKYGDNFLLNSLLNDSFLKYLSQKKILLVIKAESPSFHHPNICWLPKFLNDEIYRAVFIETDILLLSYPSSFEFKVSAVLFECFSNNKPCLLSDIPSFQVYRENLNFNLYYNSIEELIELLDFILIKKHDILNNPYKNTSFLNPTLKKLCN